MNVTPGQMGSRINTGLPGRWSGLFANPVGNTQHPARDNPRIMNPKQNTTPWSTSYAVKRKPLPKKASRKVGKG